MTAEFVEHGRSGTTMNRPELQRMLNHLNDHAVDFVIVHKIDHLARNRGDDAYLTTAISSSGARLVSTTEATDQTASGRLLHGIMASIAEFYSQEPRHRGDAMVVPADLYAEVRERLDDESRDAERERALLAKAHAEDERRLREALDILEDAAATYGQRRPCTAPAAEPDSVSTHPHRRRAGHPDRAE